MTKVFDVQFISPIVTLSESGKPKVRIQLLREGEWHYAGLPNDTLKITPVLLREFKENFDAGVCGPELPTNQDHIKPPKNANLKEYFKEFYHENDPLYRRSPSWIKNMEISEDGTKLYGDIEFTDENFFEDVQKGRVKYFSPELRFGYRDKADKGKQKNVIIAGAWTNRPYIKNMDAAQIVNLSEFDDDEEFQALLTDFGTKTSNASSGEADEKIGDATKGAQDSDADSDELPTQCGSCSLLQTGQCPFPGIPIKTAAAEDGICPKYVALDSERPKTSDQPDDSNSQEVNMADDPKTSNGQVVSLSEFEALQQQVTALSGQLVELTEVKTQNEEMGKRVELAEQRWADEYSRRIQTEDESCLRNWTDNGHLTAAQATIALKIRRAARGEDVKLSETDKEPATIEVLLNELIESIEQQVNLGEENYDDEPEGGEEPVVRAKNRNAANLSENDGARDKAIQERARDIAKAEGGTWQNHYGRATREVYSEIGRKGGRR